MLYWFLFFAENFLKPLNVNSGLKFDLIVKKKLEITWKSMIVLGDSRATVDSPWMVCGGPTVAKYDL